MVKSFWGLVFILFVLTITWPVSAEVKDNPFVVMKTNFGDIVIELFHQDAPITVDNFLHYVNTGFYDGLVFHRVEMNYGANFFVIQGGGYSIGYDPEIGGDRIYIHLPDDPNIINESYNGLSNLRGTIAMARTTEPNSANSQFFINQQDNTLFDRDTYPDGFGYCVFGQIVSDMTVIDNISQTPTIDAGGQFSNLPYNPTVDIRTAYTLPCWWSYCSDINSDIEINLEDFAIFAARWLDNDCNSANDFCSGTDLDYYGSFDAYDIALFVDNWLVTVGSEPALSDITLDGPINLEDFAEIVSNWLNTSCNIGNNFCDRADINRNGIVDFLDFALFAENYDNEN